MGSIDSARPAIIQMYVDYADTVLWLTEPINYADTALSAELVTALQAWEQDFYYALDRDYEFRTAELAVHHEVEGARLAEWVAAEVGGGFIIEFRRTDDPEAEGYLQSDLPATNPAAERCFTALVAAARAQADEFVALAQEGGLYFYSPSTGEEFPSRAQRKQAARGQEDPGQDDAGQDDLGHPR